MLASNFRVTGLPFDGDGISRVGLPLLRRSDSAVGPRRSPPRLGTLDIGVELLDATLKTVLATVQLKACSLLACVLEDTFALGNGLGGPFQLGDVGAALCA